MPNYNRKADHIKQLQGTARPGRKRIICAANSSDSAPKVPRDLSAVAKRLWKRLVAANIHLDESTTELLAAYCESYANWCLAQSDIREHGLTLKEPVVNRSTGNVVGYKVVKNPSVTIAKDEKQAMQSLAAKLGLDPTSRERLGVNQPKDDVDPFEAFLNGDSNAI